MEMAIVMARDAGMEWIFHLDTDELMHPAGTHEYSLRELLSNIPQDVDMVVFPNYENCVEHADIKEPFSKVSLFKKNFDHLPKETYFGYYKEATRGNPNYFLTYGNRKSAARIQDHLRPNGAHRLYTYMKTPKGIKLDEAAVLHFTYSKYSDLTSRRDRCGCKPTKEDVKRCFIGIRQSCIHHSFNCSTGRDAQLVPRTCCVGKHGPQTQATKEGYPDPGLCSHGHNSRAKRIRSFQLCDQISTRIFIRKPKKRILYNEPCNVKREVSGSCKEGAGDRRGGIRSSSRGGPTTVAA